MDAIVLLTGYHQREITSELRVSITTFRFNDFTRNVVILIFYYRKKDTDQTWKSWVHKAKPRRVQVWAFICSLLVESSGQHSVLLAVMCDSVCGISPTRESHLSIDVQGFCIFPSVNRHGMPMWLTLVTQSLAYRGQSEVPTIDHTASLEGLAWPKACRYTKALLSGRIFWGPRNYLPGASQGSNFSLKYVGFEHPIPMESLTWLIEFCQSVVPFQVVLNGCWWMAFLILQSFYNS